MLRQCPISMAGGVSLLSLFLACGCGSRPPAAPSGGSQSAAPAKTEHVEHAHPTEGPHHGDLVELGNEEYHGEIVHGEGGEVTVYVLDSHAEKAVPIDAVEVVINLTHNGKAEQFKLPATPDAGDPAGKSSKFSLKDEELASDLDAEGMAAKLVLSINGKSFTGKIEHHHEGAGHDHAHEKSGK
jgi:hypothetical protein